MPSSQRQRNGLRKSGEVFEPVLNRQGLTIQDRVLDLPILGARYRRHLNVRFGDERPGKLVAAVMELGEMERGRALAVVGGKERTARDVLAKCVRNEFLKSDTPKGEVRVAFPQSDLAWIFPNLFSDAPIPDKPPPLRLGAGSTTPPSQRKKDEWGI